MSLSFHRALGRSWRWHGSGSRRRGRGPSTQSPTAKSPGGPRRLAGARNTQHETGNHLGRSRLRSVKGKYILIDSLQTGELHCVKHDKESEESARCPALGVQGWELAVNDPYFFSPPGTLKQTNDRKKFGLGVLPP